MHFSSDDAQIYYETDGAGFPVILLHPFPVHHEFWRPVSSKLAGRYQLILPDLRGHGRSETGKGTASMAKHARDLVGLAQAVGAPRAVFVGVSIGGYILFELWRQARERFAGLVLSNTRAEPDTEQGRASRLKSIADSRVHGTGPFFDAQVQNLIGESTRRNRLDLAAKARAMMQMMTVEGLAAVQQGMAERPDSAQTLQTINVTTLVIAGEEDTVTPLANAELMNQHIPKARLSVIPRAGHYAAFENPEEYARLLRQFLDSLALTC